MPLSLEDLLLHSLFNVSAPLFSISHISLFLTNFIHSCHSVIWRKIKRIFGLSSKLWGWASCYHRGCCACGLLQFHRAGAASWVTLWRGESSHFIHLQCVSDTTSSSSFCMPSFISSFCHISPSFFPWPQFHSSNTPVLKHLFFLRIFSLSRLPPFSLFSSSLLFYSKCSSCNLNIIWGGKKLSYYTQPLFNSSFFTSGNNSLWRHMLMETIIVTKNVWASLLVPYFLESAPTQYAVIYAHCWRTAWGSRDAVRETFTVSLRSWNPVVYILPDIA